MWDGLNTSALVKTGLVFAGIGLFVLITWVWPCFIAFFMIAVVIGMLALMLYDMFSN